MQVPVSPEINSLLDDATTVSVRRGHFFVGVEHLFDAILDQSDLLPEEAKERFLDALGTVSQELAREAWTVGVPSAGPEIFYTPRCAETTKAAARLAQSAGLQPSAGHLLLAILADAHASPSRAMDRLGLPRGEMVGVLSKSLGTGARTLGGAKTTAEDGEGQLAAAAPRTPRKAEANSNAKEPPPAGKASLDSMTRDLTAAAKRGELEPAVGRDKEMLEICEILARKNKNNVILVGEAGVGKTQVIEGLARAGVRRRTGDFMPYRILELNVAALMSGTQYRGAFEEKVAGLLDELRQKKDTVLFIDEIHLMMGAGSTEGGAMDLANLLKPALARGDIRCIGATTVQEYRKFIEKDPALERRFQMVRVEPLTPSACWAVLKRLRPSLEEHHGVHIGSKAMHAAIKLTERYMPNRHLPDKAIDVLDQACARYRLRAIAAKSKPGAFKEGNGAPRKVTPHDIRKVVGRMAAVPVEEITADERRRIVGLDRKLNRRVIGQEQAVAKVAAAVKKSRAGLADPNRPDAVMLFLGPTGVGKTQLAKALADTLFGSSKHLITFDMSEYVERHSVSKLLGAPPGYVGSEEEGRLTGAVRSAPFSILLFDEVEKAHRQVFDVFLPILDEGRLKDSRGREASFRNTIIIFTSNIGAEVLAESPGRREEQDRAALVEALHKHFRPEFINRIDEIVIFHPLLFEDIRRILQLSFREIKGRLKEQHMGLHVYQGAYELLADKGYDRDFGARELRRAVERLVVNPISEKILAEDFKAGDTVEVLAEDGELVIRKAAEQGALS